MVGKNLGTVRRGHQRRWGLIVALLPFAAAAQGLPGLGHHDPRVVADIAAPPWNAVVRLQIGGFGLCTAVMVAPDIALTAAHCLYSARSGHFMPAEALHVLTGYADGNFTGHSIVRRYRLASGYDPRQPEATRSADAAALTLVSPLIPASLALPLAAPQAGQHVVLPGYNQDRAQRLQIDPDCEVLGFGQLLLRHSCTGTKGGSGGPLLRHDPDGWKIIGLQSGAYPRDAGGVAVLSVTLNALLRAR